MAEEIKEVSEKGTDKDDMGLVSVDKLMSILQEEQEE